MTGIRLDKAAVQQKILNRHFTKRTDRIGTLPGQVTDSVIQGISAKRNCKPRKKLEGVCTSLSSHQPQDLQEQENM